ncbi:4Fe-4S dicluster domain-containing protein [Clostridium sp. SHJSY1]|uniref:4Fe-4S dicluster domain-containing protein n=1 Tax=Clostridium sp. SHJSY1 TaxID=2942483 RepID=UPI00287463E5|nr:4Fe-4S dicluster domain-containing protein [Clostridium sp. SHJSY1]MDS0526095.1 4Fe-4S dicluster domain-containing protein [Clostridium sp. SHJSY1]
MFQFETQLDKLKHEVLTAVAKLAKEDKLTKEEIEKIPYEVIKGDVAMYRCCVYKERAIVLERAKLASGFLANGYAAHEEFVDITSDEQIVYVIEAACDKCPINKYNVTDSCRNCIAHRCQKACNFGAISYVAGRAYINQELCKECGMCQKSCPYDAISEVMRPCKRVCPTGALDVNTENRRAMIKEEKCVNCGACMSACPFGAISDKSLIVPVTKSLVNKNKLYAVVAPAITGQFGVKVSYGQIKNAIKKIGFADMVEAACGADAVTVHESNEFIERMENEDLYMTNSCCPGFLNYIEKMFPNEKANISGTVSPMIATGRYIKKCDTRAKVVFIGPCTAKKGEVVREEVKDAIDYVLTFEELIALFDAFQIEVESCEEEVVEDASIFGRGFGAAGGLTAAIENYMKESGIDIEFNPIKVSGSDEIKKTMKLANIGRLNGNFIEGMMCEGGCINGAGTIAPYQKAKGIFNKMNVKAKKKTVLSNDNLKKYKEINLEAGRVKKSEN